MIRARDVLDAAMLIILLCVLSIICALSPSVRQEWAAISEDHGE